jgi:hypothetical protein
MAYGVADGIHQREDFEQQRLLPRAAAEILGNRTDELLAAPAHGLEQRAQGPNALALAGRPAGKRDTLRGQPGGQVLANGANRIVGDSARRVDYTATS